MAYYISPVILDAPFRKPLALEGRKTGFCTVAGTQDSFNYLHVSCCKLPRNGVTHAANGEDSTGQKNFIKPLSTYSSWVQTIYAGIQQNKALYVTTNPDQRRATFFKIALKKIDAIN